MSRITRPHRSVAPSLRGFGRKGGRKGDILLFGTAFRGKLTDPRLRTLHPVDAQ